MRSGSSGAPGVIEKCAQILHLFEDTQRPLCLSAICDATSIAKATAHRLLAQLIEAGLIERTQGGYQPATSVWLMSLSTVHAQLLQAVRPILVELHQRSRCTVHIGTMHETSVLYLDKIWSGHDVVSTRVGGFEPAYCTALGRAMLAFDTEGAAEQLGGGGLMQRTSATVTDLQRFRSILHATADSRIGVDDGEHTTGVRCIATPVFDAVGTPQLAVSLCGRSNTFNDRYWRGELLQLARTLEFTYARLNNE